MLSHRLTINVVMICWNSKFSRKPSTPLISATLFILEGGFPMWSYWKILYLRQKKWWLYRRFYQFCIPWLRPKKRVVMFQEIGRVKCFLSLKTNKKEKQEYEKSKRISPGNQLKKINLRPPRWRFFSSPAFPETRVSFFCPEFANVSVTMIRWSFSFFEDLP